ncbi:hypothetical protein BGZ63DRAFT_158105 [Mariannaea sp. PMI_226]|nr:hypothetical protein BGZ63DRAFT_158105 [Mariannaea sp. PMI_226]
MNSEKVPVYRGVCRGARGARGLHETFVHPVPQLTTKGERQLAKREKDLMNETGNFLTFEYSAGAEMEETGKVAGNGQRSVGMKATGYQSGDHSSTASAQFRIPDSGIRESAPGGNTVVLHCNLICRVPTIDYLSVPTYQTYSNLPVELRYEYERILATRFLGGKAASKSIHTYNIPTNRR